MPVSGFTVVYSDHVPRLLSKSASISAVVLSAAVRLSESSAARSGLPPCVSTSSVSRLMAK